MRYLTVHSPRFWLLCAAASALAGLAAAAPRLSARDEPKPQTPPATTHRSPIALAVLPAGSRVLTANQTSNSVSLVNLAQGKVIAEIETGEKPAGVAVTSDGKTALVTHWFGYDVAILNIEGDTLSIKGRVHVGPEPRGVVIAPDDTTAYVAIGVSNLVVKLDIPSQATTAQLEVEREPRGLALSPDGKILAVGNARGGTISLVDTSAWRVLASPRVDGVNLRQLVIDPESKYAYVANMKNLRFATTARNIDQGWVVGQRVTRVPLDGAAQFETLSLDPQGRAAADAHGLAISRDGKFLAVSLGGTHEVMIFRQNPAPLPWRANGSRDLIAPELLRDQTRFQRVKLGGRPAEITFARDNKTLLVTNYLLDALQIVNAETGALENTIALGGPAEPSLERRGEALFHDATRSLNQWYSCNSCHSDGGHTNGQDFDTMNDGWQDNSTMHRRSRKKVPTLRGVAETGPWTWHGWQDSLEKSTFESFTKSMQGPKPSPDDLAAVVAYLKTLEFPPNPYRAPNGALSAAAERGAAVYRSAKAACATCHGGPHLTDGKIHDLDLGERGDVYVGHNPPSLIGVYDKDPYMHDGRARDLRETLTKHHNPDDVTGAGALSEQELADLIEYLKSL